MAVVCSLKLIININKLAALVKSTHFNETVAQILTCLLVKMISNEQYLE